MKAFEFAAPASEQEALELLSEDRGATEVLAGGTDVVPLMQKLLVTPDRVVSLGNVASLRQIDVDSHGARLGAMATLDELLDHEVSSLYPALGQALANIGSPQLRSQGTLGGELCQRPQCWYFRDGHGLLAQRGQAVVEGDNRYHAILGNEGPAKFVSPSRLAPALIAMGAMARVIGPLAEDETLMPLEYLFRTPKSEQQREHVLEPNQIVAQIVLPELDGSVNGAYEVRQGVGPDYPLAAAAASLRIERGVVTEARVVLGHVAPTPWVSNDAARAMLGLPVNAETAESAGQAAVYAATPLAHNQYKVQLAKVAVKRAILLAAGLETGGF